MAVADFFWKSWGRPPIRVPRGPFFFWLTKRLFTRVCDPLCCKGDAHSQELLHIRCLPLSLSVTDTLTCTHALLVMAYPAPRPGWCGSARTLHMVARLVCLGSARMLRVVAVVAMARISRCAWWRGCLWLGSQRAAVVAAGASQPFNILLSHPKC